MPLNDTVSSGEPMPQLYDSTELQNNEWLYFARRTGPEGCKWAEEYVCHNATTQLGALTLQQLRKRNSTAGGTLQKFIHCVEAVPPEPASVRAVLDRFRYGIEGYYFYCLGDFARAKAAMCLAHSAIERALSRADWLLLLAVHCQEFCLHQARIARNQRHWKEMHEYITRARAMMCDDLPLCELEDGKKIWWSSFQPFFDALAPLSPHEGAIVKSLLDQQQRNRLFDRFVQNMLRMAGNDTHYI
jgi:hypothetical protein